LVSRVTSLSLVYLSIVDLHLSNVSFPSSSVTSSYFFLLVSSSLEGFFDETGPFTMAAKGGIMENPYSWTKAGVNFLALESPVGVGFSYCSNQIEKNETCYADDQSTAKMNKAALIDFFNNKFPELEGGDFYVSGELLVQLNYISSSCSFSTSPDLQKYNHLTT
jgi:hypothetical protein